MTALEIVSGDYFKCLESSCKNEQLRLDATFITIDAFKLNEMLIRYPNAHSVSFRHDDDKLCVVSTLVRPIAYLNTACQLCDMKNITADMIGELRMMKGREASNVNPLIQRTDRFLKHTEVPFPRLSRQLERDSLHRDLIVEDKKHLFDDMKVGRRWRMRDPKEETAALMRYIYDKYGL